MHRFSLLTLPLLLGASLAWGADFARVDMPGIVSHNDMIYQFPAREGWEGLPLGNGTLGAQVWQPDGMLFQLNTPLSGVYGGAICRVRLRTAEPMLSAMNSFRQRLSLYGATLHTEITAETGKLRTECFIPADTDALVLTLDDARRATGDAFVNVETWRTGAVHSAANGVLLMTDTLKSEPLAQSGLMAVGEPDYRFALAVAADGGTPVAEAGTESGLSHLRLTGGKCTVWVAFAASRDPRVDVAAQARERLGALRKRGLRAVRQAHTAWWARYWSKSFIRLTSADGVADYAANLWYVHVYAMGAGSRGEVPPKFNGGLWTHDRDQREWGSQYWHWNTQESYWRFYAANHLELLKPYQDMYFNMLPAVVKWTKEWWETDGAQFQETIAFDGVINGWEKARGIHPRLPVPKVVNNPNEILSSSAEIAMQYWWYYLYTGDQAFLRDRAYPLMKQVAAFYVNYLEKDAQGRYNMYPSNSHETYLGVKNPTTDMAALRYLFPSIIRASEILGLDAEQRAVWQDRLDHLAPFAMNPKTNSLLPYEPRLGEHLGDTNAENTDLFPFGVFPLMTLGSPDRDLGVRTFLARRFVNVYGWTTDSIAAARLGLADSPPGEHPGQQAGLAELLRTHAEYYQDHPSGLQDYYPRTPALHPYLEGSGTFSTGVGEMLIQPWNGALRVCPALPKAWSADFKLLAMGGFEVTAHAEKGQVVALSLFSQRGEPVTLANPWKTAASVTCGGKTVLSSPDSLLKFLTQAGKTYLVTPAGTTWRAVRVTAAPNDAPKHLSADSKRWIGKPLGEVKNLQPPAEPNAPRPPAPLASLDRPPHPPVHAVRFANAPRIDGELDDPVWKTATSLGPFFLIGKTTPATQQTDVYLGYDDTNLYVGMVCWEARMGLQMLDFKNTPENHDRDVYLDDAVGIFLSPPAQPPWHFAINALGASLDGRGPTPTQDDRRLNPAWTVATSRHSNRWIVEAAFPFGSLEAEGPYAGEQWAVNFSRDEKPSVETSSWAPLTQVDFWRTGEFGQLTFADMPKSPAAAASLPDLVACWDFADVQGQWVRDASGRHHSGFLGGPMRVVDGKRGKALEFTGANYVDIAGAPDLNIAEAITIALWVNPKQKGSMRLVDKSPVASADGYLLDTHPENNLRVITAPGTLNAPVVLPVGEWSHVAATYDGKSLRLYLNGQVVGEAPATGKLRPTDLPLRLGADSEGWNRFVGLMEDVRIYRRALSPEEIVAVMAGKR